jgi:predicted GIY-YIG superfamily endonuclease
MSSSTTDIAERTAAARREAENLKEKIKQKKESLSDTTRKEHSFIMASSSFFVLKKF